MADESLAMKSRPTSITIISWFLIVMPLLSLISIPAAMSDPKAQEMMAKSPIPVPVQYVMLYAGLAVSVVSGIGMLRGMNAARWLYVVWSAVGLVVGLATSPVTPLMIPGLIIFVVIVFFLFRKPASRFFGREPVPYAEVL